MKSHDNKHWIEKAIQKPGSFRAAAERRGRTTAEFSQEKDHSPGKLGRRARLAEVLDELRKKSKNR